MEIKTKFALGDKVWIVNDSKAVQAEIHSIFICSQYTDYNLKLSDGSMKLSINESECFGTKEELMRYVAE